MRKSIALKTLLRSPLKTLLTFLLIAAASFALFSRITDYAITTREAAKAESFYSGVAALDNSTPPMGYYYPAAKPWPSDEQIEEFSSLPGVTLADTRYMTEGLVEDYKRVIDADSPFVSGIFVVEGTYAGYEKYEKEMSAISLYLLFDDIKVHAGEIQLDSRMPMKIQAISYDYSRTSYTQEFFEAMEEGSRYLIVGTYSEKTGSAFELGVYRSDEIEALRVIDGLGDDYLETEEFAWYKGRIEATNLSVMAYDMVYTSDMRAIPYVNEHRLVISEGRPLTVQDTDACVVSELFLETYGLSVGDKIHVQLGNRLLEDESQGTGGTRTLTIEQIEKELKGLNKEDELSNFTASAELEIIGSYRFTDTGQDAYARYYEQGSWSYGPAAIFVPSSLLPIEVPDDHETLMGDFSVFIEDPHDIKAFREAAEPLAAEMGVGLRFSDGGWSGKKDSIEIGSLASFLTTVLYMMGVALALLLAVYLYIGRNKEAYAIMRTLGVSGKKAGNSVTLPLMLVSVFAMVIGGMAGLFYASYTVAKTLAAMSDSAAPDGYAYVLNAAIPADVVVFCMVLELVFISLVTLLFLRKMKKTSPLELLYEEIGRTGTAKKAGIFRKPFVSAKQTADIADMVSVPVELDIAKIPDVSESMSFADGKSGTAEHGKYSAIQQVCTYILRHMRRGIGKTAVSFILTVVLAAGIGMFVLAKLTYQDACSELAVKGTASEFTSSDIMELSKSDLVKDIYYYNNFSVRVNGVGVLSPMTFTNDFEHYMIADYTVTYGEGYDSSVFEGTGPVCLVGQALAETLGIQPGDTITLMSESLYSFMPQVYEEDELEFAIERAGKPYQVAGILKSEDADANAGIFAAVNEAAENLYSQPFPVGYCEFTLTDNGRLMELSEVLEKRRSEGIQYSPLASFRIDSEPLETAKRIRNLLESLFPIAVAAAVLIGLFGPGLVIIQLAQEAAYLRILGVTKKRARCMLVFEQIILCIVGIVLVAGVLVLFSPGRFSRSMETLGFCWLLYFLACVCGALAAAVQVTRHRVLELLQVKE